MLRRILISMSAFLCLVVCDVSTAATVEGSYLSLTETGQKLTQKYSYSAQGSKYAVLFEPMLVRNDIALIMAVSEVAPKALGVAVSSKVCTVGLEPLGEVKAVVFRCPTAAVYVLPMKDESTAKVWGFSMWRQ